MWWGTQNNVTFPEEAKSLEVLRKRARTWVPASEKFQRNICRSDRRKKIQEKVMAGENNRKKVINLNQDINLPPTISFFIPMKIWKNNLACPVMFSNIIIYIGVWLFSRLEVRLWEKIKAESGTFVATPHIWKEHGSSVSLATVGATQREPTSFLWLRDLPSLLSGSCNYCCLGYPIWLSHSFSPHPSGLLASFLQVHRTFGHNTQWTNPTYRASWK